MNEQLNTLYEQYKLAGNDETQEQFLEARDLLGEEKFLNFVNSQIEEKKKDNPNQNLAIGNPQSEMDLTTSVPISQDLDLNQAQIQATNQVENPTLQSSDILPQQDSTDLPLIQTASSGLESSNTSQPTFKPFDKGVIAYPITTNQSEVDEYNRYVQNRNRSITPSTINTTQNTKTDSKGRKATFTFGDEPNLDILAGKSNDTDEITNESQKYFDKYLNKGYNGKLKEFEEGSDVYIDKNVIDNNDEYVNRILEREKRGEVKVARNDKGELIDKDYKVITDNILWQPIGKENIEEYNREVRNYNSYVGEQNVDSARFNYGNIGNEPEQDSYGEFVTKANDLGVLLSNEDSENITTYEDRQNFLATLEATNNAQKNGTTLQSELDKLGSKYLLSEEDKIANGYDGINLITDGIKDGKVKDKEESDFFNKFFTQKENVLDFGEYWNNEGKAKYGGSQVRENQANYQNYRANIFNDFLSYKNDKYGTDMRFIEEAITKSSNLADKYYADGDFNAANVELAKVEKLYNQYNNNEANRQNISNIYTESNKAFTTYNKQKKEEAEFQLKVENGDVLANGQNLLGQVILGGASSVKSAISGVARIALSGVPSKEIQDALDIVSDTELKVGNVKVANLSEKVVEFTGLDGNKYRQINDKTYAVKQDGSLSQTNYVRNQSDKITKESVNYNTSGFVFMTSKAVADIFITRSIDGGINRAISSTAQRISTSKKIASVFGESSQFAKVASSFARLPKGASPASVKGWTVQMFDDSYTAGERGGIKGDLNKFLYAFTVAGVMAQIQRINPDINFIKSINNETRNIVKALMSNDTNKALLLLSSLKDVGKKVAGNVGREVPEELTQQGYQDIINIFINSEKNKTLQITDKQGYKDVFYGTIVASAVLSSLNTNNQSVKIGDKEINLANYSKIELLTELARGKNGLEIIRNFKDTAYFDSLKSFSETVESQIVETQKQIAKIPESNKYSTSSLSEVTPILQEIERKKETLKTDDGTFSERINRDIAELTNQANAILDNDLNPVTNNNAETTQPTPQPETVQEQNTENNQSEFAPKSERETTSEEQNIYTELNNPSSLIVFGKESFGLPVLEGFQDRYDQSQNVLADIDFNDEQSITDGINKIANIQSGKIISETKTTPEKYIRRKGLSDDESVRTKSYLEKYLASSYKDFSSLENVKNENEINIPNFEEVFQIGSGRIEIERDGKKIPFTLFDIVIDKEDGVAEVANIQKTNRNEDKGVGAQSYIELARLLEEKGITLTTGNGNKKTDGIKLWDRLVKDGYAKKTEKGYEFLPQNNKLDNNQNETQEEQPEQVVTESSETPENVTNETDISSLPQQNQDSNQVTEDVDDENDTSFADFDVDEFVSLLNEATQSDNTTTDGNVQPSTDIVQQQGENNNPETATESTTSEGKVEVNNFDYVTNELINGMSIDELESLNLKMDDANYGGNMDWEIQKRISELEKNKVLFATTLEDAKKELKKLDKKNDEMPNGYTSSFESSDINKALNLIDEYDNYDIGVNVAKKRFIEGLNNEGDTLYNLSGAIKFKLNLQYLLDNGFSLESLMKDYAKEFYQYDESQVAGVIKRKVEKFFGNTTVETVEERKSLSQKVIPTETQPKTLTQAEKSRNDLVGMKTAYNKLSKAKKNQEDGKVMFARINELGKKLGYPIGSMGDGKISIKNPKTGKEMAKVKETFSEKIPTKKEVATAKKHLEDVAVWDGEVYNDHWESDLTWAEIRRGKEDIDNGKLSTVPARRLVNEINRQINDYGGFNFTKGAGAITDKTLISLQEIEDSKQAYPKVWSNLDLLTTQELENLYNERAESEADFYKNRALQDENNSVYEERQEVQGESNGDDKSQAELNSPEYKSLVEQQTNQEAKVKTTKAKLDSVSKNTNKDFQADQENLFEERTTQDGMFDERADGKAGKEIIATAKREHEQARAELSRLNNAVRDFESGKVTGTKSIDFSKEETASTEQATTQSKNKNLVTERIKPEKRTNAKSVKKLNEIISDAAKSLKSTLIYGNPLSRKAAGTYNPSNTLIRIKNAGDLDTVAHELGHFIDDKFDFLGKLKQSGIIALEREIQWFSERGGSNPPSQLSPKMKSEYKNREGLAEFIRAYLFNPTATKTIAPNLYNEFESILDEDAKQSLKNFSEDLINFSNASNGEKITSNIQESGLKNKESFLKFKKDNNGFGYSIFDKINANVFDSMSKANKAFAFINKLNGNNIKEILPENNFKVLHRVFAGVNGKIDKVLTRGMIDGKNNYVLDSKGERMTMEWLLSPLDSTSIDTVKEDMNEVIRLLVAERTVEYAKKFQRVDGLTGIGAGIDSDLDIAQGFINDFNELKESNKEKFERITEAARKYREYADAGLRYAVDKGRLAEEIYDKDNVLIGGYKFIKQNNEYYVNLTRLIETTPLNEDDAFFGDTGSLTSSKDILKKAKGGTDMIRNPYESLLMNTANIIKEADRNEIMVSFFDPLKNVRNMGDGTPLDFAQIARPAGTSDKNVKTIYIDGIKERWQISNDVVDAFNSLEGMSKDGFLLKALQFPAKILRNTVTHFPVFAARNVTRDTISRAILSRTGSGFKDMLHTSSDSDMFSLYGGSMAGYYGNGKEAYIKHLNSAVKKVSNKGGLVINPLQSYQDFLQGSENINRIAEYKSAFRQAKKEGLDDYNAGLYAAFEARDLMDFAMSGVYIREINKYIPFLNAGVQGLVRVKKQVTERPIVWAVKTAIYTIIPSLVASLLRSLNDDDDDYEELPAYQKDLFWNFRTPYTGNAWISIPKPYENGAVSALVDRTISKVRGKDEAFDGLAGSLSQSLIPIDESSWLGGFKPIVENMFNKDTFRGGTIVSQWEENKLKELRNGDKNASRIGQNISNLLYKTGYDLNPHKIDHLIKGYGTYFGDLTLKIGDVGVENTRNKFTISQLGFAKDIPLSNAKTVSKVYDLAEKLGETQNKDVKHLRQMIQGYYESNSNEEQLKMSREIYSVAKVVLANFEKEKGAKILAIDLVNRRERGQIQPTEVIKEIKDYVDKTNYNNKEAAVSNIVADYKKKKEKREKEK